MKYPRLLLLHMSKVHADDPYNLLVRNMFGDWPMENIAQIYTGCYSGQGEFCGQYFKIGSAERRFGSVFGLLKRLGVKASSGQSVKNSKAKCHSSFVKSLAIKIAANVIDSGLWEVIFRIRCSAGLSDFVNKFKPEIIYTQGYSIGITRLALQLSEQFKVPICYFFIDDWHSYLYQHSLLHKEVDYLAITLARRASLKFALGPKVCEAVSKRYNTSFECIYNADSISRFRVKQIKTKSDNRIIFGLTGSLYLGRSTCICDLLNAFKFLNINAIIRVYCTSVPVDVPRELIDSECVEFLPLPSHAGLPQALVECDILFLPESFESIYRSAIELSLSTKSHLYMMSKRPILVYGPEWSGTVDYAKKFGWGLVVDSNNIYDLACGIKQIITPSISEKYVHKSYEIATTNHDINILKNKILDRMQFAIQSV